MVKKTVNIGVRYGLTVDIARKMADIAEKYDCRAVLEYNGSDVNMASLLNVVAMSITQGDEVVICCHGAEEEKALEAYEKLLCM